MALSYEFVIYDSLTKKSFAGNPTPVFIMDPSKPWPSTLSLQLIAREMNHQETMFARRTTAEIGNNYDIRSFTPREEMDLCGHGLLAVGLVLKRDCPPEGMIFKTSGNIIVKVQLLTTDDSKNETLLGSQESVKLLLPSYPVTESLDTDTGLKEKFAKAIGISADQIVSLGMNDLKDIIIDVETGVDFSATSGKVDPLALAEASPAGTRSQIVTSKGDQYGVDYVKRVFWKGEEDHSTGSTQCLLIPYWAAKLGKSRMKVKQLSARTGETEVEADAGEKNFVALIGTGVKVIEGRIAVPADV